ncbi:UNVERIFIED_CONTAM: hypothetical protein FKN15_036352 [Acipenser sinensis]
MAASFRLVSRLALVTGGGSGIGRAVCQRFARDGASVVVADISEDSANETLGILSHDLQGQEHAALCVDVSSRQSVEQLITLIQRQYFRPPCVCVSSAGITLDEFLLKLEEEAFERVLRVNLKGSFLLTQAVSRALVASGSSKGVIINVGSIVGKVGNLGQANYAASKAGVEGLTKSAAKELGRLKDISMILGKQHNLLKLIIQKMEIVSEADEQDDTELFQYGNVKRQQQLHNKSKWNYLIKAVHDKQQKSL